MEQRESMYSHETYWEDFHGEKLPAPEEKEATVYKYNKEALYWLDYYEDKIGFALSEVEMQLKHAKERKKEMDFERERRVRNFFPELSSKTIEPQGERSRKDEKESDCACFASCACVLHDRSAHRLWECIC